MHYRSVFNLVIIATILILIISGCQQLQSKEKAWKKQNEKFSSENKRVSVITIRPDSENGLKNCTLGSVDSSGNFVVWTCEGKDNNPQHQLNEVVAYNVDSKKATVVAQARSRNTQIDVAKVSGDWCIYVDWIDDNGSDWYIYAVNLKTKERLELANAYENKLGKNQFVPWVEISNDKVVWDSRARVNGRDTNEIMLFDLKKRNRKVIIESANVHTPDISGNKIVWNQEDEVLSPQGKLVRVISNVILMDLSTGKTKQISKSGYTYSPVINGNIVAWQEQQRKSLDKAPIYEVYYKDLHGGKASKLSLGEVSSVPSIGNGIIAWREEAEDEIYAYDINTKRKLLLMKSPKDHSRILSYPFVNEDQVMWKGTPIERHEEIIYIWKR